MNEEDFFAFQWWLWDRHRGVWNRLFPSAGAANGYEARMEVEKRYKTEKEITKYIVLWKLKGAPRAWKPDK